MAFVALLHQVNNFLNYFSSALCYLKTAFLPANKIKEYLSLRLLSMKGGCEFFQQKESQHNMSNQLD